MFCYCQRGLDSFVVRVCAFVFVCLMALPGGQGARYLFTLAVAAHFSREKSGGGGAPAAEFRLFFPRTRAPYPPLFHLQHRPPAPSIVKRAPEYTRGEGRGQGGRRATTEAEDDAAATRGRVKSFDGGQRARARGPLSPSFDARKEKNTTAAKTTRLHNTRFRAVSTYAKGACFVQAVMPAESTKLG